MKPFKTALPFILVIFVLLVSCSKKEVKPPSEDVRVSREGFTVLDDLRKAYLNKNEAEMKALSTQAGFSELKNSVHPFDSAELKFSPRWVEIKGDLMTVNVAWEGSWEYGGKKQNERGMAVFELKGNPPRFERTIKGSPFIYPEAQ